MTYDEFDNWWNNALASVKRDQLHLFSDHPNYGAWMQALGNLHPQKIHPARSETKTFCNQLIIVHSVDPEHIVAVFALLFL